MAGELPAAADWDEYHRLVLDCLSAADLPSLMPILTDGWRRLTRAADVRLLLESRTDFQSAHQHTEQSSDGLPIRPTVLRLSGGEIHLLAAPERPLDESLVPQLSELSERLIALHTGLAKGFQSDLEHAKLESLAEFAAGAGHEINNPLATISGRVQMLLRNETDPERRQMLATIGGQALRIRDMIGDTMLFARPPQPRPELLDLADAIRTVLKSLQEQADARGSRFEVQVAAPVPVWADRTQLCIAISSLVQNSMEALHDGGLVRISAQSQSSPAARSSRAAAAEQPFAVLTIADDGPGLSEQDRQHLFDPFYSGRPAGRGLGFGLSKCWRIVTMHGGRIEVDSEPGRGATFRVYWPAQETTPTDPGAD